MLPLSIISFQNATHIYKGAASLLRPAHWPAAFYSLGTGDCGGDKKGGKDGKDDDDDTSEPCKPCPVCQCPRDYNPSIPTMYDCRKYGHCLPSNNVMPCFEQLHGIPTGIFRCTTGEVLGPGAAKCSFYQNPEYFSFQHMTYYDMHLILRACRNPSPKTELCRNGGILTGLHLAYVLTEKV